VTPVTYRAPRPRSRPRLLHRQQLRHRPSYRPPADPRRTKPKGVATAWTHVRRLLWSWWPWAILSVYYIDQRNWWAAFGIGLWAGVCSLSTPAEFPPQYGLDHNLTVGDPEFTNTMAGAAGVPFLGGNSVALLNNGDRFYPAMLKAVAEAEHSITIEAYIYWAGEIGLQFATALAEAAQRGVRVKILLDAVGSSSLSAEILQILEKGGCHVAWYNPIRWNRLRRINNRTHRKSLIIDGRIGFTGGAGIADHWTGDAQDDKHWRDLQIRVEGPSVGPLQTGFAQNWLECTSELVTGPYFYPAPVAAGNLSLQTIMSSPETGASSVRVIYCLAISAARTTIDIANPYFVPDHVSIDLFRDAVKRGVRVRVMVAGVSNDTLITRFNSVRLYGALLEAGVELYEYNRTMMHHKIMIVDGLWSTVGTSNFDNRSFSHNEENNVSAVDGGLARLLLDTYERDLAVCDRVTLEEWRRRPLWHKAIEALASFVQDQV
jgi:cardiolipin synthase